MDLYQGKKGRILIMISYYSKYKRERQFSTIAPGPHRKLHR